MDLRQYVRVLSAHWLLIAVGVVVCTTVAGVLAWTRPPMYAARTQFFVSTIPNAEGSLSDSYAGSLLAQREVASYVQLIASPALIQRVTGELGRPAEELEAELTASVPEGTSLIDVTVTDRSPRLALAIADSLGTQFPAFVTDLEKPEGQQVSPVKVSVVSPAQLPTKPVAPRKEVYLVLGLLLGLVLGVGVAVLREALDRRIRDPDDAAMISGAPILGSIAEHRRVKRQPLVMVHEPVSLRAEEFRRLRTNLHTLLAKEAAAPFLVPKDAAASFVVASAVASEGKTFVTANLGISFAQAHHRVVLVDADLRHPKLAELMGMTSAGGLAQVLAGREPLDTALRQWRGLPLEVLAAGSPEDNPTELLDSEYFHVLLYRLAERADIVIFDTPALLPAVDGAILARKTLGAILVARAGSTRAHQLNTAVESLQSVEARLLGVVVNALPARSSGRRYGPADSPTPLLSPASPGSTQPLPLHVRSEREG
jgi:tyrosine-protein kinase